MSVITTATLPDIQQQVRASVLSTLTEHFTLDRAQVTSCLEGSGDDVKIASRVAIVVIARVQKAVGAKDLVDPKKFPPERLTSVRSVVELVMTKLWERSS